MDSLLETKTVFAFIGIVFIIILQRKNVRLLATSKEESALAREILEEDVQLTEERE